MLRLSDAHNHTELGTALRIVAHTSHTLVLILAKLLKEPNVTNAFFRQGSGDTCEEKHE